LTARATALQSKLTAAFDLVDCRAGFDNAHEVGSDDWRRTFVRDALDDAALGQLFPGNIP